MPRRVPLPKRIPVGTKYVVEGRSANGQFRVFARYLVYPNGRRVDVPGETVFKLGRSGKIGRNAKAARPRSRRGAETGFALSA